MPDDPGHGRPADAGEAATDQKEYERLAKLNKVYLAIISRYKDHIEEKERISVAELPILVMPKGPMVVKRIEEIKAALGSYSYDQRFYEASVMAFSFVRDRIEDAVLPLQFWLTPEDTLTFMIGDLMDKSILLCSLLIGLGNPSCKVLTCTRAGSQRTMVYCEFQGRTHSYDFAVGMSAFDSVEGLRKSFLVGDEASAYEFNDKMYLDLV